MPDCTEKIILILIKAPHLQAHDLTPGLYDHGHIPESLLHGTKNALSVT